MPTEETVVPPVRAGEVESSIEFEYDHERLSVGGFEATGEHAWTFDVGAYADLTGFDIGQDYPYVPQANGHVLRLSTTYRWNRDMDMLSVETKGVRGTTRRTYLFTRAGHYRMGPREDDEEDGLMVVGSHHDQQLYRFRQRENPPRHYAPHDLDGVSVDAGEELVRGLHHGQYGPPVTERLKDLLVHDTPDDATVIGESGRAPALSPSSSGTAQDVVDAD